MNLLNSTTNEECSNQQVLSISHRIHDNHKIQLPDHSPPIRTMFLTSITWCHYWKEKKKLVFIKLKCFKMIVYKWWPNFWTAPVMKMTLFSKKIIFTHENKIFYYTTDDTIFTNCSSAVKKKMNYLFKDLWYTQNQNVFENYEISI